MTEYIYLDKLPPKRSARIVSVGGDSAMVQRLEDLGIVPDTEVTCIMRSPLGDPTAFLIRGAVIAIRKEDSGKISAILSPKEDIPPTYENKERRRKNGID